MNTAPLRTVLTLVLVLGVASLALAQNCCMPSLDGDPQTARLIHGIQWATGLMVVVPLILVGTIGLHVYRSQRRCADRRIPVAEAPASRLDEHANLPGRAPSAG